MTTNTKTVEEKDRLQEVDENADLIAKLRGRAPVRQTARRKVVGEPTPIAERLDRCAEAQEQARPGGNYDNNTTPPRR